MADETATHDETQDKMSKLSQLSQEDRAALLEEFQAMQRKIASEQPSGLAGNPSAEQVAEQRMQFPYYCPGCGKTANFRKECTGTATMPHAPIEVVSTDELGDLSEEGQSKHTAAPNTDG